MVYDLHFPPGFDLSNLVQPEPVYSRDGMWYFTVYGKLSKSAPAKTYMCRWSPAHPAVELVTLEQYCSARGSPASDGAQLWLMCHDDNKRLCIQTVDGWKPPLALGGGGARPPVTIPPGSPLASIWTPAYTPAEVDTAAEIAIKLTKNNDQWEQLIALLKQAGVLA